MKYIIVLFIMQLALGNYANSQQTQSPIAISETGRHTVEASYHYTTVLIFPASVLNADRGSRDLLAQKQEGVSNVIKLKAAKEGFPATNLNIFCANGKVYSFEVTYSDKPGEFIIDLSKPVGTPAGNQVKPQIDPLKQPLNESQLKKAVEEVSRAKPFQRLKSKKDNMKLNLKGIYSVKDMLFVKFEITNKSNLDYDIDFIRGFIQDNDNFKRTSQQEQEVPLTYLSDKSTISGGTKRTCIIGFSQLTLSGKKSFRIEVFEKNGSRYQTLSIQNKHLLKSQKLPVDAIH